MIITLDISMKQCSKCGEEKDFTFFKKEKRSPTGYASSCKQCAALYSRSYYEKNKEECREKQKQHRLENIDAYRERDRKYSQENADAARKRASAWAKENPALANNRNARRRAAKQKAIPAWLSAFDLLKIKCIYQVAQMRNKESDTLWHVDHIVPLRGNLVCGLHVPWNLQVIPAQENLSKNNYFEVS